MASGAGYNQRYGCLVEDMLLTTRCVDDLALWDKNMEEHWWRTIRYLDKIARNGIIISPAKFEFCSREIKFAGFRITWSRAPDIRSFFGLINQLAHYGQLRDLMAPFKPFLSPRTRFQWMDELEEHVNQGQEGDSGGHQRGSGDLRARANDSFEHRLVKTRYQLLPIPKTL